MDALDKRDVTNVAMTQGWVLPQDWTVTTQLHPDDHYGDPREAGDCYACDFAVADHHNPNKGFCEHCDQIITKIGTERAGELDLGEVDADTWADPKGSVHCPSAELSTARTAPPARMITGTGAPGAMVIGLNCPARTNLPSRSRSQPGATMTGRSTASSRSVIPAAGYGAIAASGASRVACFPRARRRADRAQAHRPPTDRGPQSLPSTRVDQRGAPDGTKRAVPARQAQPRHRPNWERMTAAKPDQRGHNGERPAGTYPRRNVRY